MNRAAVGCSNTRTCLYNEYNVKLMSHRKMGVCKVSCTKCTNNFEATKSNCVKYIFGSLMSSGCSIETEQKQW